MPDAQEPRICPSAMPGLRMVPQSWAVLYWSMRRTPVAGSISTPQKSKPKP